MNEKLTSKDYWFILICVLISVACLVFGLRYFYVAFPEASINFKVTQDQSERIAAQFLKARGFDVGNFRHVAQFDYDGQAKVFLEREVGLAKANPLFESRVRIWRWSHRWFIPLQKEEFRAEISPGGEVVSFSHAVPETLSGKALPQAEARRIAEQYLLSVAGRDTSSLEFVEGSTEIRPKRSDHSFTWKEKNFEVKGGNYRVKVEVQGDRVAGYNEFLHVPEAWVRGYGQLRSLNTTAGVVDGLFFLLTIIAMVVMVIVAVTRRDVRYRLALVIGIIGTVLVFLSIMNSFSAGLFTYVTTESYDSFVTRRISMAILGSLLAGLMFFLLTAAAEPVYRQGYPSKVSLLGLFSRRGFRTKTFFNELLLGLTLTFFFFAYQIAFYLLANKFGAWAPADVPYDDLLNTRFPWVAVLLIGFMPSISEEFMSRMFSIPFLQRYLKSTLLALIIPAFIWGFGHSTYPNQPFFIRGLEVGIAGILVGIVMLRWGIFAALVWHFTVDALYTALLLFRSSNSYFVISGAVSAGILVLPLLLCLLAYVLKRGFVPEAGLRNADGPMARAPVSTEKPKLQVVPSRYRPPSRRAVVAWAVIALLSLLVFVPRIPRLGSYVRFDRPARRAQQLADQALIDRGVNLKDFLKVTKEQSSFGAFTSKYILQRKDIDYLNAFWEGRIRTPSWSTRYFKPLQKEEYAVNTDPRTGALISISHSLAEEAPGPHLSSDSARTIAEGVLRAMGLDQSAFTLQESTAEEKKARRDHQFTWEAKDSSGLNLGDAKYRAQVSVAGDQVSSYSRFLKLPEAWLRDQQERVMWKTVCEVLSRILFIALGVAAAIGFVIRLKDRLVPWRPVLILSVVVALAVFLVWLNSQTTRYADYDTTTPLSVFQVQNLAGGFAALIGGFVATVLALAISFGLDPDSATLLNRKGRAVYAPVALSGLLLLLILDSSAGQLSSVLTAWFGRFANLRELPLPGGMTTLLPFVHTLLGAFSGVFRSLALFVMASYLWRHRLRWLWVAVALAAFLLSVVGDPALKTAPEVGFRLVTGSLYVVGGVLFIALVARNNLLFYALAGFVLPCYQNAVRLVSQGAPWFRLNGILVLATVALILLWLFVEQARQRATTGPTA